MKWKTKVDPEKTALLACKVGQILLGDVVNIYLHHQQHQSRILTGSQFSNKASSIVSGLSKLSLHKPITVSRLTCNVFLRSLLLRHTSDGTENWKRHCRLRDGKRPTTMTNERFLDILWTKWTERHLLVFGVMNMYKTPIACRHQAHLFEGFTWIPGFSSRRDYNSIFPGWARMLLLCVMAAFFCMARGKWDRELRHMYECSAVVQTAI